MECLPVPGVTCPNKSRATFAGSSSLRKRQACAKHIQRHLVLLDVSAA